MFWTPVKRFGKACAPLVMIGSIASDKDWRCIIRLDFAIRLAFAAVLFAGGMARSGHAEDSLATDQQRAEAVSLFQALEANWAGLQYYDVIATEESFSLEPGGKSMVSTSRYHLVGDLEESQYLLVGSGGKEITSPDKSDPWVGRVIAGFVLDSSTGMGWTRSPGLHEVIQHVKGLDQPMAMRTALARTACPDVRLIGSRLYPSQYFADVSFSEHFRREFHQGSDLVIQETGDGKANVIQTFLVGESSQVRREYLFDREQLVPLRIRHFTGRRDALNLKPDRVEVIEWMETNGVVLPKSIKGQKRSAIDRSTGELATEYYDVSFTWKHVNQRPTETIDGVELLNDIEKMQAFLTVSEVEGEPAAE
ncbi:hypothetical protein K227x_07640 [Rubripirellula lacrimiformis]|uniref:Uncharacterized protein n=1 Tax=Rubripirellula lacrimiformis TaxID=1930273 RepID=A0A517N5T4_9BACT|nr:hypothetical protein [Rubripirellula lacrimiformis]QDT02388.1 hypothetical protein K227x_07640 [Rubripirellula lacrimiformis]